MNTEKYRFKGMETTPDGILIMADANGKNIGDGYVQFTSQEHAEQALLKHKETIDKRYIEGFGSVFLKTFVRTVCLKNQSGLKYKSNNITLARLTELVL